MIWIKQLRLLPAHPRASLDLIVRCRGAAIVQLVSELWALQLRSLERR